MNRFDSSVIDSFSQKVKIATRSQSKDVRLTIEEANELSLALVELLNNENKLLKKLAEKSHNDVTSISNFSGGTL